MRKTMKKVLSVVCAAAMVCGMVPNTGWTASVQAAADTTQKATEFDGFTSDLGDGSYINPVLYTDVADPDITRAGDAYYMITSAMSYAPGCPVLRSYDLVNWETVSYVYDTLSYDNDALALRNGQDAYGWGQWASDIVYFNDTFYVLIFSYTTGNCIYSTKDIESGKWQKSVVPAVNAEGNGITFHDPSLLFEKDEETGEDRYYVIYGQNSLYLQELSLDKDGFFSVKEGTKEINIIPQMGAYAGEDLADNSNFIIAGEGCHISKVDGKYYIIFITWPSNSKVSDFRRQVACYQADDITGPYTGKIVMNQTIDTTWGEGIAQGAICSVGGVDTPYDATKDQDGNEITWKGIIYQDRGAVGRIPMLVDVDWTTDTDGLVWPMMSVAKASAKPIEGDFELKSLVVSDEFDNGEKRTLYPPITKESPSEEENGNGDATEDTKDTEIILNGNADKGTENWTARDGAKIETAADGDNQALKITDRTTTGAGPEQDVTGRLLPGRTYDISFKVKYEGENAPATRDFALTYTDGDWTSFQNMITGTAKKGEWTTITGTYTVPDAAFDTEKQTVFIETTWTAEPTKENDWLDFCVDDISIIRKQGESADEDKKDDVKDTSAEDTYDATYPVGTEFVKNGNFESQDTTSWNGRDNADVTVVSDPVNTQNKVMYASKRTTTGGGPRQDVTGKVFAGKKYKASVAVYYNEGPDEKTFNLTLEHQSESGALGWTVLASKTVKKGEWTIVEGETILSDTLGMASNNIYVETPYSAEPDQTNDLMSFYVDNISLVRQADPETVKEGENDYNGSNLNLAWQWNHNPDNTSWSLTAREGWLRLTTGHVTDNIQYARNTLTQRCYGPQSQGTVKMDISNMKDGDYAGLTTMQSKYGNIGVKMENGKKYFVYEYIAEDGLSGEITDDNNRTLVPVEGKKVEIPAGTDEVYLRLGYDFEPNGTMTKEDATAYFYYSLDGKNFTKAGELTRLWYGLYQFTGYKFGLFNYATEETGGYVDFDYFRLGDTEQEDTTEELPFTDVNNDTNNGWYRDAVAKLNEMGLMTGMNATYYGAYEEISRAQFAVILYRLEGEPESTYNNEFPDVKETAGTKWYTSAVAWANKNGLITGYTHNGHFGAADPITREQLATILYRYANWKGYDLGKTADLSKYKDSSKVSTFAADAMPWIVANEIIGGKDNGTRLAPQETTKRSECAVILYRFLENVAK